MKLNRTKNCAILGATRYTGTVFTHAINSDSQFLYQKEIDLNDHLSKSNNTITEGVIERTDASCS